MDRLRVAVIDTGIDPSHPALAPVAGGARLSLAADGAIAFGDDWMDAKGHGTACAGAISRDLGERIELLAVRVVDDDGTSTVRLIEAALAWALERGARVVNASLGAPVWQEDARARLAAVCAEAARRGVVVVAAAGPDGTQALPAVLDEVISVGGAVCPPNMLYLASGDAIDFRAKGDFQRAAWLDGQTVIAEGSSLAAAHVTNAVCRLLLRAPDLDLAGVRAALAAQAVHGDAERESTFRAHLDAFYLGRTPASIAWLRRAAVYPFNKETHALVRFRHLLPFDIAAVADPPGKRLTGRDAGEVLGEAGAGLSIRPSFDAALDEADGVIIGHLEAMSGGAARARLAELVERAIARGVGVYSFSRLAGPDLAGLRAEAARRGVPCVDPTLSRDEVAPLFGDERSPEDPHRSAILRRNPRSALLHDCPVLGVFGTSRAQGKFSLQLALRARLAGMGYRVAHLATEPTGMLFGASATLPTGYERGNDLSMDETGFLTSLLATEIKNRERPDLLLVGGQSGILSLARDQHRIGPGSIATLAFAAAAQPDACILVCNTFDPPDHVDRCRAALESVLACRVIACAFGDQVWEEREWKGVIRRRAVRLDEAALALRLVAWERHLGLPCGGVLSPEGTDRLAEAVVEYFAGAGADTKVL